MIMFKFICLWNRDVEIFFDEKPTYIIFQFKHSAFQLLNYLESVLSFIGTSLTKTNPTRVTRCIFARFLNKCKLLLLYFQSMINNATNNANLTRYKDFTIKPTIVMETNLLPEHVVYEFRFL